MVRGGQSTNHVWRGTRGTVARSTYPLLALRNAERVVVRGADGLGADLRPRGVDAGQRCEPTPSTHWPLYPQPTLHTTTTTAATATRRRTTVTLPVCVCFDFLFGRLFLALCGWMELLGIQGWLNWVGLGCGWVVRRGLKKRALISVGLSSSSPGR